MDKETYLNNQNKKRIIHENVDNLLSKIDWKGISLNDINNITHEVKYWAVDCEELFEYKRMLNLPIEKTFKEKLDDWLPKRIQMVLDRK